MENENVHEVIIIGSGPAGLTAAIYTGRANLKPLVIGGEQWGGQLMNTTDIENFPGFPEGIPGPKLMQDMITQAKRFDAEIRFENATSVETDGDIKIVKTANSEYKAKSVIVATGATPRRLNIPGEDKFYGRGVSTCATCDGAFYRDKIVAIVGGGDSAMEEATFLTRFAKKVYIIHRRDEFRASPIMAERALSNEKIEVLWNTVPTEVVGEDNVEGVMIQSTLESEDHNPRLLEIDGFFLAIGHIPVTSFLEGKLELDDNNYIISNDGIHTSKDGIFVAGDVEDQVYRQAITAAGNGCRAALEVQRWLESKE